MKKITAITFFMIVTSIMSIKAQLSVNELNFINLGIGLGSYAPISLSYERGVSDNLTVGGLVNYWGTSSGGYKASYIGIGGKLAYHLNNAFDISDDNWDLYAGATLAYAFVSEKYTSTYYSTGASIGGIYLGGVLGARYFFSEKIGAYAEAGYGVSYFNLGVTVKL